MIRDISETDWRRECEIANLCRTLQDVVALEQSVLRMGARHGRLAMHLRLSSLDMARDITALGGVVPTFPATTIRPDELDRLEAEVDDRVAAATFTLAAEGGAA